MPLAEIRDGVVIGMLVGRQEAKGHIFMGSGFDLARAIDPHAGAVKQEPQHHLWRIGRLAAAILGIVRGIDRTKVQRLHHIHQKARKMLLWKPIVQRRRQQQSLIQIVGAKTLSHEQHLKTDAHSSKRFCRTRESIPDTLLGAACDGLVPTRWYPPPISVNRDGQILTQRGKHLVLASRGFRQLAGGWHSRLSRRPDLVGASCLRRAVSGDASRNDLDLNRETLLKRYTTSLLYQQPGESKAGFGFDARACAHRSAAIWEQIFMQIRTGGRAMLQCLRQRIFAFLGVSAFLALHSAVAVSAQAVPEEAYGPYNAIFLPDGPGLTRPLSLPAPLDPRYRGPQAPDPLIAGAAQWTLAFWFQSSDPLSGVTLLAGFGDPNGDDARFVGVENNHLGLWLGNDRSSTHLLTSTVPMGQGGWHFAAAVSDGQHVMLFGDGAFLASWPLMQGTVDAQIHIAPAPQPSPKSIT